jgi:predicted transcriptional regulator
MKKKQKTVYLDENLLEMVRVFADNRGRSFTWIAEQAIKKYIGYRESK